MSKPYIINDETPDALLYPYGPTDLGRGLELPFGNSYEGVADPYPESLLIPRSEWQARIQERQERKATLEYLLRSNGVKVKDQARTSYCWINAPTFCVEINRCIQGQKHVVLSPASAGARIKNFRNVGGWGKEGLEFIIGFGVAPVDLWPANAISRQYDTESTRQAAMNYRVVEWWELRPRNLDQLMSCLLRGVPVAVGYNWWGHEVTALDPVWMDGTVALRIGNSWGEAWGEQGYGVLQGNRILPDDAVAPRTALPDFA